MDKQPRKKRTETQNPFNAYVKYSSLAIQMMVVICAGVYGGYRLDKYWELGFPVFTLLLSLLSVGGAIWIAVKDLLKK